jgi:diguanylate cyclase (GGDEF)-like protein/PAS domain S-box-containing protein
MAEDRSAGADPAVIEAAAAAMLNLYPDAIVTAIDLGGLFVPLPDSVPVTGHRVAHARTALDLVRPADRPLVISTWDRVKSEGASRATVTVVGEGAGQASLHFFDLRPTHGVFLGLLVALDANEEQLDEVAEIGHPPPRLAHTLKDELALIIDIDADLTAMLGWERDEIVGKRSLEFIHPDDHDRAINAWLEVLTKPGETYRVRLRHAHRDGRWIWLEIANRNLLDQPESCVDCEMFDISDEMEAQEAVRASEQLLRRLAGALPVGVVQLNRDRSVVYANDRIREILGAGPDATSEDMVRAVVDSAPLERALEAVFTGEDVDLELRIDRLDGGGRRVATLALRALTSPTGEVTGAVGCLADLTDSARMRAELQRRATLDDLTSCASRATTLVTLDSMLAETGPRTAAIFVDLDGFKAVNDQFGHALGDTLLVAVAARLRDTVRAADVVGRIGGDEFLVLCPDVADADVALALGERIADAVAAPLDVEGTLVEPRASVGVAWAGTGALRSGVNAEVLIAEADAAMYASKAEAEGRAVLAGRREARRVIRRRSRPGDLAPKLRNAIANQELELHYQPVVDLNLMETVGYEALLRWRRGDRIVPAADFIQAAEMTGLVCEIGPWVIDEVCRQAVSARRPDLSWFINVSPRELAAPRTVASFGLALEQHGISPPSVVVEITEHATLADDGIASGVITELLGMGFNIALDDFGTGHSSLATALHVPARWVKIDRRFTAATVTANGRRLVAGIVALAGHIGAGTIAEGIETRAELAALAELGVSFGQGYLLGRPVPFGELGAVRVASEAIV